MILMLLMFGVLVGQAKEIKIMSTTPSEIPYGRQCEKRLKTIEEASVGFPTNGFKPKCSANGNFELSQCSSYGCWCADPETGAKVKNTQVVQLQSLKCGVCHKKKLLSLEANKFPLPICTTEGLYNSVQCADGLCWCVAESTGEIYGDKVDASIEFTCEASKVPKIVGFKVTANKFGSNNLQLDSQTNETLSETKLCEHLRSRSKNYPFKVGGYRQQCTEKGHFKVKQCHGSTGYCWCVDPETGVKVPLSDSAPGTKLHCKACHKLKVKLLESEETNLPKCSETGEFQPVQCASEFCWCVNEKNGEIYGEKINSTGEIECVAVENQKIIHQHPEETTDEVYRCPIGEPLLDSSSKILVRCHWINDTQRVKRCPDTHFCNNNPNGSLCCPLPPLPGPIRDLLNANCSRPVATEYGNCLARSLNGSEFSTTVTIVESVTNQKFTSNFSSLLPLNISIDNFPGPENETAHFIRVMLNQTCQLFESSRICGNGLDLSQCPILEFSQNLTDAIMGVMCDEGSLEELLAAAECFSRAARSQEAAKCSQLTAELLQNSSTTDPFGPQLCSQIDQMFSCLAPPAKNICGEKEANKHLAFTGRFMGRVFGVLFGPDCTTQLSFSQRLTTKCQIERNEALSNGEGVTYIPICSSTTGLYEKKQCNKKGETCWCVAPESGNRVPGNKKFPLTCP